jgi:hypothetical protein
LRAVAIVAILALAACATPTHAPPSAAPSASSAAPAVAGSAAAAPADKVLENRKGGVDYELGNGPKIELAPHASQALSDQESAITDASSLADVTLPDSSVVTIGANSKVQLAFFNQAEVTKAQFIVYNGTVRFSIHHPQGAAADYKFETPTAEIAVRGTEGDIAVNGNDLQVNVYEVTDPKLPVQVKAKSGQSYTLPPGKSLSAHVEHGVFKRAEVHDLSRATLSRFTREFGQPRGVTPEGKPIPHSKLKPKPTVHPKPKPKPTVHPKLKPTVHPKLKPTVHPKPKPTAHPKPKPTVHPKPKPTVHPKPKPTVHPKPKPTVHPKPKPTAHPKPKPKPEPKATEKPKPKVKPSPKPKPTKKPR